MDKNFIIFIGTIYSTWSSEIAVYYLVGLIVVAIGFMVIGIVMNLSENATMNRYGMRFFWTGVILIIINYILTIYVFDAVLTERGQTLLNLGDYVF